jgi:hypothetical protein
MTTHEEVIKTVADLKDMAAPAVQELMREAALRAWAWAIGCALMAAVLVAVGYRAGLQSGRGRDHGDDWTESAVVWAFVAGVSIFVGLILGAVCIEMVGKALAPALTILGR